MSRFQYLKGTQTSKVKARRAEAERPNLNDRVVPIYVRQETLKAVKERVRHRPEESISELVEDLLLGWLRHRST